MQNPKNLNQLFEMMWEDYCRLNPQARQVFETLIRHGESVVNDHIALRTFGHSNMKIEILSQHFIKFGYSQKGDYRFNEKKLRAQHFEHQDSNVPLVFISELDLADVSPFVRETVAEIAPFVTEALTQNSAFLFSGRPWPASYEIYKKLAVESEYAAWVYAHGFRPNHFTVYINQLKKLNAIHDLNSFLKEHGFTLNSSGGEIKGSPRDFLEQSSTMANPIPVRFSEGFFTIPGCYYEFAKRYPLENGQLFRGFIADSANKIFESTDQIKTIAP